MNDPSLALSDPKEAAHLLARNDIRASLVKTEKGCISNCLANFVRTLQEDPVLKGAICLNLLTERVDMLGDLGWPRSDSSAITDTDLHYLALHLEKHYGLSSEKKLRSAVDIVANENRYHPIRNKLNSLTWDGIPRIRNCLHHFLGAAEDDYTQALMQHFLLGAIRRIFHPGCKYEEILCLVGGQGIGKTTFLRFLAMGKQLPPWRSVAIRCHDFRVDFCTRCYYTGIPLKTLQTWMGYSDVQMITEIYSKLTREQEACDAIKLTAYMSQSVEKTRDSSISA